MDCGCSFQVNEEVFNKVGKPMEYYTSNNITPPITIEWKRLPDCKKVWDILGEGYTKGVFQLESGLGRSYAKKLKPTCLEHLSALGSILRPGCLESLDEKGISTTDHYCLRKNLAEEVTYPHDCLRDALGKTYGIPIYQEQAIAIARIVAGFSLQEADILRRGIGKKLAEVIAQCRTMFIEGAKKTGIVSDEVAHKLFDNIEASQRYSFNKCLSPYTLVTTKRGEISLKDVMIGDKVLCPGDKWANIKAIYNSGNKHVYFVKFYSGHTIKCSIDHKFLSVDGILPLHQIFARRIGILSNKGTYEHIESITAVGIEQTMDIEIDSDNHIFFGDGLATSNSHSYAYALNGYRSGYAKVHTPVHFFCSYLRHAENKQKPLLEIAELVNEAKIFGIKIYTPSLANLKEHFHIVNSKGIRYGIIDIKGIGHSQFEKIKALNERAKLLYKKELHQLEWNDFLPLSNDLSKTIVENLILSGATDCYDLSKTHAV